MAQDTRPDLGHRRQPNRFASRTEKATRDSTEQRTAQDDATIQYVKRVLCAKPVRLGHDEAEEKDIDGNLEDLLPPLTSQRDVDVQLYAIIAIILSQFVQSWYNKMTPDADFVRETVAIIAHCTRGIEKRLECIDLESLLLDELPGLLDDHLDAVQPATKSSNSQIDVSVATIYHALHPHNALSPLPDGEESSLLQRSSETDWSQLLVSSVLPLLLPSQDLANPCLNVLVNDIFAEMIVRNAILGKSCEPWLLWEGVTKVLHLLKPLPQPAVQPIMTSTNRLEQFGLLSEAEAVQQGAVGALQKEPIFREVASTFWTVLQHIFLAWVLLRAFATALMQASTLPTRSTRSSADPDGPINPRLAGGALLARPIVDMRIWSCLTRLTSIHIRMPWLTGWLAMMQCYAIRARVCSTDSAIDRLLSAQLHERLLNPALLPPLLQAIRSAVFPDNVLGLGRQPPTSEEIIEIKRRCARAVVDVLPEMIRTHYFATMDLALMQSDVERVLDLFADPYINKHLIVAALELLSVRLFPELSKTAVEE